jgi:hypothetical protein
MGGCDTRSANYDSTEIVDLSIGKRLESQPAMLARIHHYGQLEQVGKSI